MDLPVYVRRADKSPPPSEPTGGALSGDEYDGNLDETERALTELDAETIKVADAAEVVEGPGTLEDADRFLYRNSLFDPEAPVEGSNQPWFEIEWLDMLAAVLGEIPDGPGTAEEIRDALETLTGTDRLSATALDALPETARDALASLTGANRLSADAIKDLPTLTPGDPVTITHDGAGEDPVVGDTLTATPAAGWGGPFQWTRDDGTGPEDIVGATAGTHVVVEDDEETEMGVIFGDPAGLHFRAVGPTVALPSASAPDAFEVGDWTATAGVESIVLNLTSLPADGGSAITALEYRLDGGSAVALSGTGTGERTITGLTGGVEYDVEIRAVNAIGNGAWSDLKARTPTAASSGLSIVQAPAYTVGGWGTTAQQDLSAVGSGNSVVFLVVSPTTQGAPTVADSGGTSWGSPIHSYAGSDKTYRWYKRDNITDAITWVRATFSTGDVSTCSAVEVSGSTTTSVDASGGEAQSATTAYQFPVTTTVDDVLVMCAGSLTNAQTATAVSPLTLTSPATPTYDIRAAGIFPTAGSNTPQVNLDGARSGEKAWVAIRAGT
jgi:hypothetical protein